MSPCPPQVAPPPGSKTITIIDGSSGKRQDVVIPGNGSDAASKARERPANLLEATASRRHPEDRRGRRAAVRAPTPHPRQLPPDKTDAPRIAIVVGGLGISATGTADALAKLPAPVTLAFAPYGADLDKLAQRARARQARSAAAGADGAVRLSRQRSRARRRC